MIRVGIFGVTGYGGYEAARWLQRHPEATIAWAVSDSNAGSTLSQVVPGPLDMPLLSLEQADWGAVDVVLTALPHGVAARMAQLALDHDVRVVDFSADLRLDSAEQYRQWYGAEHPVPALLSAPYGLPELNRAALADVRAIANPGCYPTSVLLAMAPSYAAGIVELAPPVIVHAASGVSGAGRGMKQNLHFVEANENLSPYNVGRTHRHVGEMQQELTKLAQKSVDVVFAPHLLPVQRGILSTMYVQLNQPLDTATVHQMYAEFYANEPFVAVLPLGQLPSLAHVVHTNRCALGITVPTPNLLIVHSAIDNLVKGAAGQAIQNINILFGLPETTGLLA